jgi:hypothetical protein
MNDIFFVARTGEENLVIEAARLFTEYAHNHGHKEIHVKPAVIDLENEEFDDCVLQTINNQINGKENLSLSSWQARNAQVLVVMDWETGRAIIKRYQQEAIKLLLFGDGEKMDKFPGSIGYQGNFTGLESLLGLVVDKAEKMAILDAGHHSGPFSRENFKAISVDFRNTVGEIGAAVKKRVTPYR